MEINLRQWRLHSLETLGPHHLTRMATSFCSGSCVSLGLKKFFFALQVDVKALFFVTSNNRDKHGRCKLNNDTSAKGRKCWQADFLLFPVKACGTSTPNTWWSQSIIPANSRDDWRWWSWIITFNLYENQMVFQNVENRPDALTALLNPNKQKDMSEFLLDIFFCKYLCTNLKRWRLFNETIVWH